MLSRQVTRNLRVCRSCSLLLCRTYAARAVHASPRHEPLQPDASSSKPRPLVPPKHEGGRGTKATGGKPRADALSSAPKEALPKDSDAKPPTWKDNIQTYLESLSRPGQGPDLDELLKFRPKTVRLDGRGYNKFYYHTAHNIDKSFTRDQVLAFSRALGAEILSSKASKRNIIHAILATWGMVNPAELASQRLAETAVTTQSFPVTPSELFLLLGTDGSNLLRVAGSFQVRIFVDSEPLSLRVEGTAEHMDAFARKLQQRRDSIITKTIVVPFEESVQPSMLQTISRLAGAFVENLGDGTIRIAARKQSHIANASRLCIRAANSASLSNRVPVLSHVSSPSSPIQSPESEVFPQQCSLFPFLSSRAMPWTLGGRSAFRARRVGEWLFGQSLDEVSGLNGGVVASVQNGSSDIKETLLSSLPDVPSDHQRRIRASSGHIVMPSQLPSYQASQLISPLPGAWPWKEALNWLRSSGARSTFIPSLPKPLLSKPPNRQTILHRLTYRSLLPLIETSSSNAQPTRVLRVEVVMPAAKEPIGALVDLTQPLQGETSASALQGQGQDILKLPDLPLSVRVTAGLETSVLILLPDRSMDASLNAYDFTQLSLDNSPTPIQGYISALTRYLQMADPAEAQPDPPPEVVIDGIQYHLETNVSAHRSVESLSSVWARQGQGPRNIKANTESVVDLETGQNWSTCEVDCSDINSDDGWGNFLQSCDALTVLDPSSVGQSPFQRQDGE